MTPSESIPSAIPWTRLQVDQTGSTNADLLEAAANGGLADRTVLRTDHQTAGRGRLDRKWDAPAGSNLLASVYLEQFDRRAGEAVQRIGVALVDAIESLISAERSTDRVGDGAGDPTSDTSSTLGLTLGLKWPNDVLLDDRKLAGVLAQRSSEVRGVVVGFGVNLGWAPPEAARLGEILGCTASELLDAVLESFDALPSDEDDFAARYRRRLLTIGQRVRIHLPAGRALDGVATDVDAAGRIVVTDDHGVVNAFDVGDVVHLRPH